MIIFSDLHLSKKTEDVALAVLDRIGAEAKRTGERHIAFLGDFFEVRHVIVLKLLIAARDAMRSWDVDRIDVLPGNHDAFNVAGRNALEVFDGIPNCVVHTDPAWTDAGLWLPYRHSEGEIKEALSLVPPEGSAKVLFAHLAVRGSMMNNHVSNSDGVDDAMFKSAGFKRVFLGHYHKHQTVRKGVVYVGSPYQVTYGEAGQEKGYMTWDGAKSQFVELDVGPRHHKITIDADHPESLTQLPDTRPGDKLWVLVKGHMAGAMRDTVASHLQKAGLDVERLETDLQPTASAARLERAAGDTIDDLAHRFVEAQDLDDGFKSMLRSTWGSLL